MLQQLAEQYIAALAQAVGVVGRDHLSVNDPVKQKSYRKIIPLKSAENNRKNY